VFAVGSCVVEASRMEAWEVVESGVEEEDTTLPTNLDDVRTAAR